MLDFVDFPAHLHFRIYDSPSVLKEGRQYATGDVAVFVDGSAQCAAAALEIPGGVVRAASEERYSKRRPVDDHFYQASFLRQGAQVISLFNSPLPAEHTGQRMWPLRTFHGLREYPMFISSSQEKNPESMRL
jgi:hypothetical protein